jgi:hypothetical protein
MDRESVVVSRSAAVLGFTLVRMDGLRVKVKGGGKSNSNGNSRSLRCVALKRDFGRDD